MWTHTSSTDVYTQHLCKPSHRFCSHAPVVLAEVAPPRLVSRGWEILRRRAQRHPWFRRGFPPDLDLDEYNKHYVDLSAESADAAAEIKAVIREAVAPAPAPTPMPQPVCVALGCRKLVFEWQGPFLWSGHRLGQQVQLGCATQ